MAGKSLIESDFLDGGDEVDDFTPSEDTKQPDTGKLFWEDNATEVTTTPKKKEPSDIEVEISDDKPEADRGKWVADDDRDGEPEFPTEEEVRGYTKNAQKRINQMTARINAERRRADEVAREHEAAVQLAQRLIAENNNLKNFVENGEKVLMGEHKARLQGQLDQAKAAYREAHDAGDASGMIAAQEQIAKAVAQMERASMHRPMQMPREDENVLKRPQAPAQAQPDPEAVKWQEKNKWFGRDDAMTAYALGYHKQLIERDGITPDNPEYYSRLNAEMRRRFPDRLKSESGRAMPERRQASPVSPVSRTGNGAAPRRVTITESQARLAKRLGLTVEQYAEQVAAEQDQRDGRSFTHR